MRPSTTTLEGLFAATVARTRGGKECQLLLAYQTAPSVELALKKARLTLEKFIERVAAIAKQVSSPRSTRHCERRSSCSLAGGGSALLQHSLLQLKAATDEPRAASVP